MNSYVKLAIQQAESSNRLYKIGAVLVKGKSVIGAGCNRGDHPKLRRWRSRNYSLHIGLHAEMAALWQTEAKGGILYVVRLRKDGTLGLAKPCKICRELIKEKKIKKVYYSTNHGQMVLMKKGE